MLCTTKGSLVILFIMFILNSTLSAAAQHSEPSSWKLLSPLPDPVGFGGMFAGVLGDRLVGGGGSQFRHEPIWLGGKKVFSDRLYALREPLGSWEVLNVRLPEKSGHFASAATTAGIYIAGGITATGYVQTCYVIRERGGAIVIERLADLPVPMAYGAAAVVGDRLFVAGGQHHPADKQGSAEMWSLELHIDGAAWQLEAAIPGPGVFVPSAGSDGNRFYLFGGMGFDADGRFEPSKRAYQYDPASSAWQRLPDLPEPRVAAASPCPLLPDGGLILIGGYARSSSGPAREHGGFSAQTFVYEPLVRRWRTGPTLPAAAVIDRDSPSDAGPSPMIAAPCAVWRHMAVVVSGEVRASVRTPTVIAWPLHPRSK